MFYVGEHHPAEQGLRLEVSVNCLFFGAVGEHHPAEQGLRLTHIAAFAMIAVAASESIIQQNKD